MIKRTHYHCLTLIEKQWETGKADCIIEYTGKNAHKMATHEYHKWYDNCFCNGSGLKINLFPENRATLTFND